MILLSCVKKAVVFGTHYQVKCVCGHGDKEVVAASAFFEWRNKFFFVVTQFFIKEIHKLESCIS